MYVKLFQSILQSSIWEEDAETCKVWITLLALADEDGMVNAAVTGIAHEARLSLERTTQALTLFETPDADSRNPDNEGRRIEKVPGGYIILNYQYYRSLQSAAERREAGRKRVARYRGRRVTPCNACNDSNVSGANVTQAEADSEADTEAHAKETQTPPTKPAGVCPSGEKQNESNQASKRESKTKAMVEDEPERVINAWNVMAPTCGLARIEMASSKRVKDLKAKARIRLRDKWWSENWQKALAKVNQVPFLLGEGGQGWKADMDFFLKPDSVAKIMEGKYDGATGKGGTHSEPSTRRFAWADEQKGKFDGR